MLVLKLLKQGIRNAIYTSSYYTQLKRSSISATNNWLTQKAYLLFIQKSWMTCNINSKGKKAFR